MRIISANIALFFYITHIICDYLSEKGKKNDLTQSKQQLFLIFMLKNNFKCSVATKLFKRVV